MAHLLLQLKYPIHQRLARGRTPGDINIHGHNPVAAPRHTVTVVVIPAPVSAAAHTDHPPRLGHLVVDLAERGSHLVGEGAGHDHDVGLAGGGAEDYSQAVLVVARSGEVHHFDGAAGEAEGHGPEGALAGPVGDLVHCRSVWGLLAGGRGFHGSWRSGHDLETGKTSSGHQWCLGENIQCVLHDAFFFLLSRQGDFSPWFAGDAEGRTAFDIL